jgi:basic amino acid/polyamine antiporter, APA family
LGIVVVMLIYLAINLAYLNALGFTAARQAQTPAADVLMIAIGPWGGRFISILVMLSALGAINGMILTGSRIYAVWGADYPALAWLNTWNRRTAAPMFAIALQAIFAGGLVLLVGTEAGRGAFDWSLGVIGSAGLPWGDYRGGFNTLVAGSAPAYWSLCLLTGIAVFVLRSSDHGTHRSFSMPFYPLPAIAFCATCAFLLWSSLDYARWLTLISIVPLAAGLAAWVTLRTMRSN